MADLLKKDNQHLLLEKQYEKNNSFIAAINKLVKDFPSLVAIDKKFTLEDIELLTKLVKEEVDINIEVIADDLKKSTFHGYRKLDIDLLTNFAGYTEGLSDEEKRALWNDPSKQVYYDKITVYFTNSTNITKTFSELVNNHHRLYSEIDNWTELKDQYGATSYNISTDTPIENHELFRIWDTDVRGSNIDYITLHVAPRGQNQEYDSVFAGAKSYAPTFEWLKSTSTLSVIAHRINEIIHASDYIEAMGKDFEKRLEALRQKCLEAAAEAEQSNKQAQEHANEAQSALNKQVGLTVQSNPVAVDQDPSVVYDGEKNIMTFSLPRSEIAVLELSSFAVNTANGHLSLGITNDKDVKRVYIDEVTGNVIIELNK